MVKPQPISSCLKQQLELAIVKTIVPGQGVDLVENVFSAIP